MGGALADPTGVGTEEDEAANKHNNQRFKQKKSPFRF